MKPDRIKDLCRQLPAGSSMVRRLRQPRSGGQGGPTVDLSERISASVNDPAFGWKFVSAFIETGEEIPNGVLTKVGSEKQLRRAFDVFNQGLEDMSVAEALMLEHPRHRKVRSLLQTYLLGEEFEIPAIAEKLKLAKDTIEVYAAMFWDVRDRITDHIFVAGLLYPDSRIVEFLPDYLRKEDITAIIMRVGFNYGESSMLAMAGVKTPVLSETTATDSARRLESLVMNNALLASKMGMLNQPDAPGIMHARNLIAAGKQSAAAAGADGDLMGLPALQRHAGESIWSTLKLTQDTDSIRRLALQETFGGQKAEFQEQTVTWKDVAPGEEKP